MIQVPGPEPFSQKEHLIFMTKVIEAARTDMTKRAIALHTMAWFLVLVCTWDGIGLIVGGENVSGDNSYDILRMIPGGMRSWGGLAMLGAIAISWGIGRDGRGHPRALNSTLAVGVGYYCLWSIVIPATWILGHEIPAWGLESKQILLTCLYFACARAAAPRGDSTWYRNLATKRRRRHAGGG